MFGTIFSGDKKVEKLERELKALKDRFTGAERQHKDALNSANAKLQEAAVEAENRLRQSVAEWEARLRQARSEIEDLKQRLARALAVPGDPLAADGLLPMARFIRVVGAAFLTASVYLAYRLAGQETWGASTGALWAVYLFAQFGGLYALSFGKRRTVRTHALWGGYMTGFSCLAVAGIAWSLVQQGSTQVTPNLVGLLIVNGWGFALLRQVEFSALAAR